MVVFHKDLVLVAKHNEIILNGNRNHKNGMWEIPLPLKQHLPHLLDKSNTKVFYVNPSEPEKTQVANGIIKKETTIHDLINF